MSQPTANTMNRRPALAVILARAGSKGLPRKNALLVAGKSCVQWTIEAAQHAETVGMVALSTDDPDLLSLANRLGISAVRRPGDLASDSATVDAAARHALAELVKPESHPDPSQPVVILYGNVPVRPAGLIDRAVRLMLESGCDSVQSYAPVGKHHPWWTVRIDETHGTIRPWEGEVLYHNTYRRQDLPPAFVPDGGVLVVSRRALLGEIAGVNPGPHAFLGIDRRAVINPEGSVVDIDSRIDLLVADAILRESAASH